MFYMRFIKKDIADYIRRGFNELTSYSDDLFQISLSKKSGVFVRTSETEYFVEEDEFAYEDLYNGLSLIASVSGCSKVSVDVYSWAVMDPTLDMYYYSYNGTAYAYFGPSFKSTRDYWGMNSELKVCVNKIYRCLGERIGCFAVISYVDELLLSVRGNFTQTKNIPISSELYEKCNGIEKPLERLIYLIQMGPYPARAFYTFKSKDFAPDFVDQLGTGYKVSCSSVKGEFDILVF